jgi:hypothetical protein
MSTTCSIRIPSGNDKGKCVSELVDSKVIKSKLRYYRSRPDNEALIAALEVRLAELEEQARQARQAEYDRLDRYNDELRRAARAVHAGKYTCEQAAQILAERFNASERGRRQIERQLAEHVGYLRYEHESRQLYESTLAELEEQVRHYGLNPEAAAYQLFRVVDVAKHGPGHQGVHDHFQAIYDEADAKAVAEMKANGWPDWAIRYAGYGSKTLLPGL